MHSACERLCQTAWIIVLLKAPRAWAIPGVSMKMTWASAVVRIPTIWLRVVWGLGVTMVTFWPRMELSKVDLPEFGGPMRATQPQRNSLESAFGNESLFFVIVFSNLFSGIFKRRDGRQDFAFQQLEGGAAAGGDIAHIVGQAITFHCSHGIAAANHYEGF